MRAMLPAPKFNKYVNELTFPLPIMETADVIYSGLSKIFDGQNKAIYPTLSTPDLQTEFETYLEEAAFYQFWESRAWEAYRSQHNCIITIDLPSVQDTYRPQPYLNIVDIAAVKDVTTDKDGWITELIYINSNKYLIGIDELSYWIHEPIPDTTDYRFLAQGFHGLNYCPAKFLIDDSLDTLNPIVKESPVSKVLFAMEKLLFRIITGENLENYAGYPIAVLGEQECEYQDADGNRCQAGFINYITQAGVNAQAPCPVCSDNHLVGEGSAYEVRRNPQDGKIDLDTAVKWVSPDIDGLNYKDSSIERRTQSIIASCVGQDTSAMTGQAQNEKQIASTYENSQTILNKVKRNMERTLKFCMDTMGKIMYEDAYIGSTVNLGTRFFLATPEQIQAKLTGAIASGAPDYEIGMIRDEMNATEYQNDPRMINRLKILKRLEPYPNRSITDMDNLVTQNKISDEDLLLKYNFTIFIEQFEDENGNVAEFGSLLPFAEKIKRIKQKLYEYVKQELVERPAPSTGQNAGQIVYPTPQ